MNPGDIQPGRARDGGASPDRYTSSMSEARRKGLIFIDYLRNEHGATAVAPYSVRARLRAPVAVSVG